jgi:hypothetical protein
VAAAAGTPAEDTGQKHTAAEGDADHRERAFLNLLPPVGDISHLVFEFIEICAELPARLLYLSSYLV